MIEHSRSKLPSHRPQTQLSSTQPSMPSSIGQTCHLTCHTDAYWDDFHKLLCRTHTNLIYQILSLTRSTSTPCTWTSALHDQHHQWAMMDGSVFATIPNGVCVLGGGGGGGPPPPPPPPPTYQSRVLRQLGVETARLWPPTPIATVS
jgi:hypothetical protein